MKKLTTKRLREVISYNPDSGIFTWKVKRPGRFTGPGEIAGSLKVRYRFITIDCVTYRAHRLALFYMTGRWPKDGIDHINGNGYDNRWINLREATTLENLFNSRKRSDNTSGIKGVYWAALTKRWVANICSSRKTKNLASFANKNDAAICYNYNAAYLRGQFAYLNKITHFDHD